MPGSLRACPSRRPGHRHTDLVTGTLLRLAAFTTDPSGGNPAGVWIGEVLPADGEMQRIAAEVGYSETAFLAPDGSGAAGRFRVRYFSPLAEVPFCGHATIAGGVALAERGLAAPPETDGEPSRIVLTTNGGPVAVATALDEGGRIRATLTTVSTWVREPEPGLVAAAHGSARLAGRGARSRTAACDRVRRREAPHPRRPRPLAAGTPRVSVRAAPGPHAGARPDDDPARLARVARSFPRA